mmetsp:Transcript_25665/g.42954  ORF Transcript_25665/g.42954 Transcript_25665/m.42954 type:complete len:300 (-) Transcript_25665:363-1262(-)
MQNLNLCGVDIQRLQVREQRRDPLLQKPEHVHLSRGLKVGALEGLERDALDRCGLGILLRQPLVQRLQPRHLHSGVPACRGSQIHGDVQSFMISVIIRIDLNKLAVGCLGPLRVSLLDEQSCTLRQEGQCVHDLFFGLVEASKRLIDLTTLLKDGCAVQKHFRVLVSLTVWDFPLDGALIRVQHLHSELVTSSQMMCNGKSNPVHTIARLERQKLAASLHEVCPVTHLHLQERQITQDLRILLIQSQRVLVALDGLTVVPIRSVQQPVHVPANMAPEVLLEALAHELVRILLTLQAVQG